MALLPISLDQLVHTVDGVVPSDLRWSPDRRHAFTVALDDVGPVSPPPSGALPATVPAIVIGVSEDPDDVDPAARAWCDVVSTPAGVELEAIERNVHDHPIATTAAALLLRGADQRSFDDGLLLESATYSTLQAGPEFTRWRTNRTPSTRERASTGPAVVVDREGDELLVNLNRPDVRNALDVAMRDGLLEALTIALADPAITDVHLRGNGEAFCTGGDLDEFGSFPDPAVAHLIRLDRSIAALLHALAPRVTAHLHGWCVGSGIELAACGGRVLADPSTTIQLPEVTLGLVPGAGGTASLPRRIGRHRTALLVLGTVAIDAETALAWGLVDALS